MMSTIAHLMAYGLVVVYGTGKNSFYGERWAGGGSDFTDRVVSSTFIPNYEKFQKVETLSAYPVLWVSTISFPFIGFRFTAIHYSRAYRRSLTCIML